MKGKFFKMVDYIKEYPYIIFQGINGKYEYGYNMETKEWKGIRGTIKTFPVRKVFSPEDVVWEPQEFIKEFSKYLDIYYPYKNIIIKIPVPQLKTIKNYLNDKSMYSFLEENKDKEYCDGINFECDFIEFIAKKNNFIIPHWLLRRGRGMYKRLFDFIEKYQNNIKVKNIFNKIFSSTGYFYNDWQYTILAEIDEYITLCNELNIPIETGDFFRNYDNILKIKESRKKEVEEKIFKKSQTEKNLFFENEDFITIIPTTYKEVREEGEKLHNCLGTIEWRNYLSEGTRKVVFIRKKDSQDKSYIACDITKYGNILQFLKKCNKTVDEKDGESILNFREKYQEYLHSIWFEED